MRLHRSERLQSQWYSLPPLIRQYIESLKSNPRPPGILETIDHPGRYEEFVSGRWIIWEVEETSETVIRVTISE
jgi:hypothetical protein